MVRSCMLWALLATGAAAAEGPWVGYTSMARAGADYVFTVRISSVDGTTVTEATAPQGLDAIRPYGRYGMPYASPDGRRVIAAQSDGEGGHHLVVMDPDGANAVLLQGAEPNWGSHWAPDGSRLVFVAGQEGQRDIAVANADGSNQHTLTYPDSDAADDHTPYWTPDGTRIAFVAGPTGQREILLVPVDGGPLFNITSSPGLRRFMIILAAMEAYDITRSAPAVCSLEIFVAKLARLMICMSGLSLRQ